MTVRRIDALQNRTKLLDAAEAVFLDHGVDASPDLIAARAGVGRATLFRNFADRNALVLGILDRAMCELEEEAAGIADDGAALRRLLRFVADRMIYRAPIVEYWRRLDQSADIFIKARERLVRVFEAPVRRAVAERSCRADLSPDDIPLLVMMLGGGLYAPTPERRKTLALRAWQFVSDMAQLDGQAEAPPDRNRSRARAD